MSSNHPVEVTGEGLPTLKAMVMTIMLSLHNKPSMNVYLVKSQNYFISNLQPKFSPVEFRPTWSMGERLFPLKKYRFTGPYIVVEPANPENKTLL